MVDDQGVTTPSSCPGREHTDLQNNLTDFRDTVLASRDTNPVIAFTTSIADVFRNAFDWLQRMVSVPDFPRPVPQIGWLGVTAVATWVGPRRRQLADRPAGRGHLRLLRPARASGPTRSTCCSSPVVSVFFAVIIGMPLAVLSAPTPARAR